MASKEAGKAKILNVSGPSEKLQPLSLRAPLDQSLFSDENSKASLALASLYDKHDWSIRPSLCSLLVAARVLRLSIEATYTAAVLLHRYRLATAKDKEQNVAPGVDWVPGACLYLACKSEEEPRRLRDVINCVRMIRGVPSSGNDTTNTPEKQTTSSPQERPDAHVSHSEPQRNATGESCKGIGSTVTVQWNANPPHLDKDYWQDKAYIVPIEQLVLRWLGFDVTVSHPHRAVVLLVQDVYYKNKNDPFRMHQRIARAWEYLNHGIFSVASLRHSALALAVAALQLAIMEEDEDNSDDEVDVSARGSLASDGYWKDNFRLPKADLCAAQVALRLAKEKVVGTVIEE